MRRARRLVAFALAASLVFYAVPLWLGRRIEPALSLAALMVLDAACVAALARTRGSLAVLAALAGLAALTAALRGHLFVALPSVALYGALAAGFAVTLRPGSTALITRIALQRHGAALGPAALRYLRGLTAAWAIFFGAMAAASAWLAHAAAFETWSLFANLLAWPLTGAMFLADYALRRLWFRQVPPDTPIEVIAATLSYRPSFGGRHG